MSRFWNLKTQFVLTLVLLLLGALALQSVVLEINKKRLLRHVQMASQEIADEIASEIARHVKINLEVVLKLRAPASMNLPKMANAARKRAENNKQTKKEALSQDARRVDMGAASVASLSGRPLVIINVDLIYQSILNAARGKLAREGTQALGLSEQRLVSSINRAMSTLNRKVNSDIPLQQDFRSTAPLAAKDGLRFQVGPDGHLRQTANKTVGQKSDGLLSRNHLSKSEEALSSQEPVVDISRHLDDLRAIFEEYRRIDIFATLGIFLCGIAAALFFSFRITRPIYEVVEAIERVAAGDLDTHVDSKKVSAEFAVLGAQFNSMVQSLRENQSLERELEQRERVQHMGDLAAGIAHDVRNPLNAIHLNMGQVRDEFLPDDPLARERFLRFTGDAQAEVKRLNGLVSNFLSLAQPSTDLLEELKPNELVEDLRRLLSKEATDRKIDLNVTLESDLPTMCWERQELKSAFLNVAMNALQSIDSDGGQVDIITGLREGQFDVGPELVVSFVDTGRGISNADLKKVLVPYFTTRSGGTGLGLAIAQRIAERNGGHLEIRSRVDEGTTVSFVFPVDNRRLPPERNPGQRFQGEDQA